MQNLKIDRLRGTFMKGNNSFCRIVKVKGVVYLLLKSNNRILKDDAYLKFFENPKDTSLKGIVSDCESIKEQLKGYKVDQLNLIRASTKGAIESLKIVQMLVVMITIVSTILFGCFSSLLRDTNRYIFSIILYFVLFIIFLGFIAYGSILLRRRIGAAVFIGELVDICIKDIEKAQRRGDKFENRDKEDTSISYGTI